MKWLAAIAVGLALLLYLRSPIDLLPDRFGLIGLLDDALVILAAIWWLFLIVVGSGIFVFQWAARVRRVLFRMPRI